MPPRMAYTYVEFSEWSPACLRSTEPPGTFFHWTEPNAFLCGSGFTEGTSLCNEIEGHPVLCTGDSADFRKE